MIKYLTINISSPICNCPQENLAWGYGDNGFELWCRGCETHLKVPKYKLHAYYAFDTNYPEGSKEVDNVKKLTVIK